jgi:hypothetical protein
MKSTRSYLQFIDELKKSITKSRYQAARLANQEQLLLYLKTGMMLSAKINQEKWGAKVLENISSDLQHKLPGLRGFSRTNLKKMRQFFEAYEKILIGPSLTAQLQVGEIRPLPTVQMDGFFGISFTHHILILNKCFITICPTG